MFGLDLRWSSSRTELWSWSGSKCSGSMTRAVMTPGLGISCPRGAHIRNLTQQVHVHKSTVTHQWSPPQIDQAYSLSPEQTQEGVYRVATRSGHRTARSGRSNICFAPVLEVHESAWQASSSSSSSTDTCSPPPNWRRYKAYHLVHTLNPNPKP